METKVYNTTDESRAECMKRLNKNDRQAQAILHFFQSHPGARMTPFEVLNFTGINAPITSIRRSISDLTKKGLLIKTSLKKMGELGANNCTWELAVDLPGLPITKKVKQADALIDVFKSLMDQLEADTIGNPKMVFSDDQAKRYREIIKTTVVANGYSEILPLIQY